MSEYIWALVVASVVVLMLSLFVLWLLMVTQKELSEFTALINSEIQNL